MTLKQHLLIGHLVTLLLTLIGVFIGINYMLIDQEESLTIMVIVSIASLLGLLPSLFINQKVLRSLQLLVNKMQAISSGQFQTTSQISSPLEFHQLDTKFNHMAQDLQMTFQSLKESEQEKALMVSQLAHDIKTPLTSIQASIEGILDGIIQSDEVPHYLNTMHRQTKRLNHLVDKLDYLSLAIEENPTPPQTEAFYLDQVIVAILAEHRLQLEQEKREVSIQMDPEAAHIHSHYHKLYRILDNLIHNALKYSPQASPLHIQGQLQDHILTIQIIDQGQGIAPEDLPHIFKRFYRVESSRNMKTGGHGLGLAIAQELAQQLGGHIQVKSQLGVGSQFTLVLPIS